MAYSQGESQEGGIMIIWLIGLSGAGKTTIGHILYDKIKKENSNTVFLDGDILRDVWGDQLGHDIEGRRKNAERFTRLCQMLDRQGIHVVAAILSIFPEERRKNRDIFSRYFEVFIDTPMEELMRRDSKGLYAKAAAGEIQNVVGFDIPMPRVETWDMIVSAPDVLREPEYIAEEIRNRL